MQDSSWKHGFVETVYTLQKRHSSGNEVTDCHLESTEKKQQKNENKNTNALALQAFQCKY